MFKTIYKDPRSGKIYTEYPKSAFLESGLSRQFLIKEVIETTRIEPKVVVENQKQVIVEDQKNTRVRKKK
jgi:hypothetical protein